MSKLTIKLDSGGYLSIDISAEFPWQGRSERDESTIEALREIVESYSDAPPADFGEMLLRGSQGGNE